MRCPITQVPAAKGIPASYPAGRRSGRPRRDGKNIRDVAVLYWDGRFETIPPERFDAREIMARGAYQCRHFGPRLLDDEGRAMTDFNADSRKLARKGRT